MTMLRRATADDVPAMVALLRDDPLGAGREGGDLGPYRAAFAEVDADPRQLLLVAESDAGAVVGTMQLTLIPGLSRSAATRLQVEAVRVAADERGTGLGGRMLEHAHDWGRAHGATLAQLTTDLSRADAHRFYERHGYEATHIGMKRGL